ncbi:MAG: hypothetical protein HW412_147 [Bacteroidetes bacterium]|nr:hypothetical protein [Bacteroidota bacterium]
MVKRNRGTLFSHSCAMAQHSSLRMCPPACAKPAARNMWKAKSPTNFSNSLNEKLKQECKSMSATTLLPNRPKENRLRKEMGEVEKIEQSIQKLSREDLVKFRTWFAEFENRVWDQKIEADLQAGKLDGIIAESLSQYSSGKAREL